ncbi:CC0125/CC1285 family lipoprotein [Croceibacterium aestuarii]|uniref:CC0125/CC1285 family lipoprotein n=1 Tax=Croceibacterium aestuarii TaxID=3064139 RepID=UPI00272EA97B|nr:hypothetical protein [Croceibacterium sp. D39]
MVHQLSPSRGRFFAGLGLAAALALSACATPTPYQPIAPAAKTSGGYYEERLAADRWLVSFAGNRLTSRATVEGYLLFRAAELTQQQGYGWFEIVDREVEHEVQREVYPDARYDPWWGYPAWRPYWHYYEPRIGWRYWYPGYGDSLWSRPAEVQTVERFEAHAEIVMHRGRKPASSTRAFHALEVIERLGPTIKRPS